MRVKLIFSGVYSVWEIDGKYVQVLMDGTIVRNSTDLSEGVVQQAITDYIRGQR